MPYTKYHDDWADLPSLATPIDAAALEHIEEGIATAQDGVESLDVRVGTLETVTGEVSQAELDAEVAARIAGDAGLDTRVDALESAGPPIGDHGALTGLGDDDHPQYALKTYVDSADSALDTRVDALEAAPPPVVDHGALTGLADNDHPQYALDAAVTSALALKAPLASPALTGSPTAPTQSPADNSTKIATTAYVDTADGLLVPKSLFDANTILAATADNTPVALTVAASRILGRKASGDIAAMTTAELSALFGTPTGTKFLADDGTLKAPGGGAWALKSVTTVRRSSGDINLQTATVTWANTQTALDLVAAAAAGDRARVYVTGLAGNESAAAFIDAVTAPGGVPTNSFANQGAVTSTPPFYGVPTWRCHGSSNASLSGFAELVLGAGDLSGGNVTIRFRSCTDANSTKTLFASANYAFTVKLEIWTPT